MKCLTDGFIPLWNVCRNYIHTHTRRISKLHIEGLWDWTRVLLAARQQFCTTVQSKKGHHLKYVHVNTFSPYGIERAVHARERSGLKFQKLISNAEKKKKQWQIITNGCIPNNRQWASRFPQHLLRINVVAGCSISIIVTCWGNAAGNQMIFRSNLRASRQQLA